MAQQKHMPHIVFCVLLQKGLNPSVARPSLKFLTSFTGYSMSKSCHVSALARWLISFSMGYRFNFAIVPLLMLLSSQTSSSA
jgi:hypothetical protein